MPEKNKKSPRLTKQERSLAIDAQYGELITSRPFRSTSDAAYEASFDDGDTYRGWRESIDRHIGELATAVVDKRDLSDAVWDQQRKVALDTLGTAPSGPFANYVFKIQLNGRAAEVEPSEYDASDLPPGEPDVVATNQRIVQIAKSVQDPLEFLRDALDYTKDRRQQSGSRFEGPENYATAFKFFSDKTSDSPLADDDQKKAARRLVSETLGNFLRIADDDEPNVIEMTNIYAATHRLPKGIVEKKFSSGIIKNSLKTMDDFSAETINTFLRAIPNLDTSECGDAAAMAVDLALRKGPKYERSGDLLSSLRAVASLPKTSASERAFTTLLDVRSALEVSSDLEDLKTITILLHKIVNDVTESTSDTMRAQQVAEFIRRRSVDLFKNVAMSSKTDLFRAQQAIDTIQKYARAI